MYLTDLSDRIVLFGRTFQDFQDLRVVGNVSFSHCSGQRVRGKLDDTVGIIVRKNAYRDRRLPKQYSVAWEWKPEKEKMKCEGK